MEADFSGYATKNGLKCSDGRTILAHAFKDNDGQKVPLVWQHMHNEPANVLGHALLENREDGVYAYGFFNDGDAASTAKNLVKHGDVSALSIYANQLVQKGSNVVHGSIKEVSLVLSGANPGAFIDNVNIAHGDDYVEVDDEAIIYTGLTLEHQETANQQGDNVAETPAPADSSEKTVKDIFDAMTEEEKNVVYFMIGEALKAEADDMEDEEEMAPALAQSDLDENEDVIQHNQEGTNMSRNVFEQNGTAESERTTLSHSQIAEIVADAQRVGSFKEAFLAHAATYGIENIDVLFPDAKSVTPTPEWVKRETGWVAGVINGTRHTPFSRIKSTSADITADEARALGYIKGNMKKEEFFNVAKRVTTPKTIYKKQKLDRDDIIDITDLDVVAWLKAEMRMMLEEELARAILIGDGRDVESEDKIDENNIRPIAKDDPFYAHPINLDAAVEGEALVEAVLRARKYYKGSGNPTFYTTEDVLTGLLLAKDKMGRRLYDNEAALASAMRVARIVPVEVMESEANLVGIIVNIGDYTVGADRGGSVSMFDDFDIDYNQYKYLIETRVSGALTMPKSALVIKKTEGLTEVTPTAPTQVGNVVTIPSVTGVLYTVSGLPVTGDVTITEDTIVDADPTTGYIFPVGATASWNFLFSAE